MRGVRQRLVSADSVCTRHPPISVCSPLCRSAIAAAAAVGVSCCGVAAIVSAGVFSRLAARPPLHTSTRFDASSRKRRGGEEAKEKQCVGTSVRATPRSHIMIAHGQRSSASLSLPRRIRRPCSPPVASHPSPYCRCLCITLVPHCALLASALHRINRCPLHLRRIESPPPPPPAPDAVPSHIHSTRTNGLCR